MCMVFGSPYTELCQLDRSIFLVAYTCASLPLPGNKTLLDTIDLEQTNVKGIAHATALLATL